MSTVYEVPEKVAIQIYKTKNYDQFYLITGNRDIKDSHIKKLMVSMSEEECMSPIQVNEKLEIIDGQHRFRALQNLKKPVYYYIVKGATIRTVQRLNSYTKNWTTEDYMSSFVESGYKDYQIYKEFKDTYKFGNSVNLLLLTQSWDRNSTEIGFKNGEFKIKDIVYAGEIASKLEKMSQFIPWYKERSWCYAMYKSIRIKGFDFQKFLDKLKYQSRKLVKCANTEQYLDMIQEIYNFKSRKEEKLILRTIK